jgi:hypothetical protein
MLLLLLPPSLLLPCWGSAAGAGAAAAGGDGVKMALSWKPGMLLERSSTRDAAVMGFLHSTVQKG